MKTLIFILVLTCFAFSQEIPFIEPDGGEGFNLIQSKECLSDAVRISILKENRFVIDSLRKENESINEFFKSSSGVKFGFPLKAADNFTDYGFYGISGFVDHNPAYPNQLLDYYGGTRTYDVSNGYNHQGTDYFTWPFGWYKMDYSQVEVVAAERGIILGKLDGNYDRNCDFTNDLWNAVYIVHSDNSVAWYGHFKRNSTTSKSVGEIVEKGEYLGIVGSSGSSTGPHLHFEIYNSANQLIDPYHGPFNLTTDTSWWNDQEPYYEPRVNVVLTHSAPPVFPPCPQQEVLNLNNQFKHGELLYLATYYKDQLRGDTSRYTLLYPDGTIANQWMHSISDSFYAASYWYWYFTIPPGFPFGEYTFRVEFHNNIYEHRFYLVPFSNMSEQGKSVLDFSLAQNFPNPFNPVTTINFSIPTSPKTPLLSKERGRGEGVTLKVYDMLGREVAVLVNEEKLPGNYEVVFDASKLSSGVYIYRLTTGNLTVSRKMLVVK